MSEIRIASRYAKSLVGLATEQGKLDRVAEDVQIIYDMALSNPDLKSMLVSPVIKSTTKITILGKIFSSFDSLTSQFLVKVVEAGREALLHEMANQFIAIFNDLKGIAIATVTTAMPLGEANIITIKEYISQKINKPHVNLTVKTDPGIIGGLIINYEDKLLDMSIKSELHKLKISLN